MGSEKKRPHAAWTGVGRSANGDDSRSSNRSSSSGGGGGGSGGGQAPMTALADLGRGLLLSFLLPLGPLLIDRRLNPGYFRESDTPIWWALVLLSFWGGEWLACAVRARASSWHLYMSRPPRRRAARVQLTALVGLVASVASTGVATRLHHLLLARFCSGFCAVFLWGHARERVKGGGAAAASAGLAAMGRWSNNLILPQHRHHGRQGAGGAPLGEEGPLISPMAALGTILGGLIGGLTFPTRTFALVDGHPALFPSLVAAACALLIGCLVLRRLNRELTALGSKHNEGASLLNSRDDMPVSASSSPLIRTSSAASNAVVVEMGPLTTGNDSGGGDSGASPPATFVKACGGDEARARAKWAATLAWRRRERVDGVLGQRQPYFATIKQYYPHFVHGRSKRGEVVVYEFPGRMDLCRLKSMGIGAAEIGRHYVFFQEFVFRRLTCGDEGRVMTVLDIGGLGLGTLSKDVLDVLRTTSEIMNNHYPERVSRICVVNAPFFAGAAWRVLQAVLPQSVQDKIELTADPGPGLAKYIDTAQIPACYQGTSPLPLGESEEEGLLREVVAQAARSEGPAPPAAVQAQAPPPAAAISSPPPLLPSSPPPASSSSAPRTPAGGWLPSLFGGKQGSSGKGKPQQAHLGYENRFVFDQQRKIWVLEEERPLLQPHTTPLARPTLPPLVPLPAPSPSPPATCAPAATSSAPYPMQYEQEEEEEEEDSDGEDDEERQEWAVGDEEDGLILAIQAAHYAERLAREGRSHPSSLLLLGAEQGGMEATPAASSSPVPPYPTGKEGQAEGAGVGMLQLRTALVYTLWAGLEGVVHAVLPVWTVVPYHLGGLGLETARSVGLMLSLGIAVLLAVHTYGPHSFLRLPWASPLRAFRLAVTGVVVAALGLGLHPRITVSRAGQPSGATRFVAWLLHTALLTGLVAALAVGRAAAAVLLDMASRPTAAAAPLAAANGGPKGMAPLPPARLSSVSALASGPYPCSARGVRLLRELSGQVAAPWVAGALLSYGMQAGLPYPSDARLPFNLCALGTVGLYLMTLQLRVHLGGHLSLDAGEALSHNHFRFKRSAAATRRH